jgi:hypothetical protein
MGQRGRRGNGARQRDTQGWNTLENVGITSPLDLYKLKGQLMISPVARSRSGPAPQWHCSVSSDLFRAWRSSAYLCG